MWESAVAPSESPAFPLAQEEGEVKLQGVEGWTQGPEPGQAFRFAEHTD